MAQSDIGTVQQIDGVVASFGDYDGLILALRDRATHLNLSYASLDFLCEFADGQTGKYLADARTRQLTLAPLLKIAEVLAVKTQLIEDAALLRQWRPHYEQRQGHKCHARGRVKLGATTLKRVRGPVLSELGRLGARARNAALDPAERIRLARLAAFARWRGKRP